MDKIVQQITDKIEDQPEFVVKSSEWLVSHQNLARMICAHNDLLSDKEFEEEFLKAIKTQDYAYYALLEYQKAVQQVETDNH